MQTRVILALTGVLLAIGGSVLLVGSSHREAPLISEDPSVDNTDLYAFVDSNDPSKVNFIATYYPLQEPNGGPNFYRFSDDALYSIHIDNNGDGVADITFSFEFETQIRNPGTFLYNTGPITSLDDPDFNIRQHYEVSMEKYEVFHQIGTDLLAPPVNIGPVSTPDYEALAQTAVYDLEHGIKVFAGQRDDPFFVDLGALFDFLTIRQPPGNMGQGFDGLSGLNVNSIALQVPIYQLTKDNNPIIGVWATTSRHQVTTVNPRQAVGPFRQVSRLGMPLVNEVFNPLGIKDTFNMSSPQDDAQLLPFVFMPELARFLNSVYGGTLAPIEETGRADLVTFLMTGIPGLNQFPNVTPAEMLRLNTSVPPCDIVSSFELELNSATIPGLCSRMGLLEGDAAGFPNGRRLGDDVVDAILRALGQGYGPFMKQIGFPDNSPNNLLGDGVDANDVPFLEGFPYLGTPHQGFDHKHMHGLWQDDISR